MNHIGKFFLFFLLIFFIIIGIYHVINLKNNSENEDFISKNSSKIKLIKPDDRDLKLYNTIITSQEKDNISSIKECEKIQNNSIEELCEDVIYDNIEKNKITSFDYCENTYKNNINSKNQCFYDFIKKNKEKNKDIKQCDKMDNNDWKGLCLDMLQ